MGKATASRVVLPPSQLNNSLFFFNESFRDCSWLIGIKVSVWKTDVRVSVGRLSAITRCPRALPAVAITQDSSLSQWEVGGPCWWLDRSPTPGGQYSINRRLPIYGAEHPPRLLAGDWGTTRLPRSSLPQSTDGRSICGGSAGNTRWSFGEKGMPYFLFYCDRVPLIMRKVHHQHGEKGLLRQ